MPMHSRVVDRTQTLGGHGLPARSHGTELHGRKSNTVGCACAGAHVPNRRNTCH
jgi:hypothetical protein